MTILSTRIQQITDLLGDQFFDESYLELEEPQQMIPNLVKLFIWIITIVFIVAVPSVNLSADLSGKTVEDLRNDIDILDADIAKYENLLKETPTQISDADKNIADIKKEIKVEKKAWPLFSFGKSGEEKAVHSEFIYKKVNEIDRKKKELKSFNNTLSVAKKKLPQLESERAEYREELEKRKGSWFWKVVGLVFIILLIFVGIGHVTGSSQSENGEVFSKDEIKNDAQRTESKNVPVNISTDYSDSPDGRVLNMRERWEKHDLMEMYVRNEEDGWPYDD